MGKKRGLIDGMREEWKGLVWVVEREKEGKGVNIIKVEGVDWGDEKVMGKGLEEIGKNGRRGGL